MAEEISKIRMPFCDCVRTFLQLVRLNKLSVPLNPPPSYHKRLNTRVKSKPRGSKEQISLPSTLSSSSSSLISGGVQFFIGPKSTLNKALAKTKTNIKKQ